MAWWNIIGRRRTKRVAEWLVAGLGNPGAEYHTSRHNFGWRAAEALAHRCRGRWTEQADPPLAECCCRLEGSRLRVIKPQAYMNRSGETVLREMRRDGLEPERLIVLVDDLALPLGSLRIRRGGGDGGHNGLKSIIEALGGGEFIRVRLGVAPEGGMPAADRWVDFVLGSFDPNEMEIVGQAAETAADAVTEIIGRGPQAAMSRFNRRPPK